MSNETNLVFKNWSDQDLDFGKKEIKLEIITAKSLDDKYIKQIAEVLAQKYNFIPSPIINFIDPDVVGGVKVIFDSKVIDGTLKGKLDNIKNSLKQKGYNK